jgi:hypothetical protein
MVLFPKHEVTNAAVDTSDWEIGCAQGSFAFANDSAGVYYKVPYSSISRGFILDIHFYASYKHSRSRKIHIVTGMVFKSRENVTIERESTRHSWGMHATLWSRSQFTVKTVTWMILSLFSLTWTPAYAQSTSTMAYPP